MMDFGSLHLGTEPFEAAASTLWADCLVNRILLIICAFLILIFLNAYLRLWPMLSDCLVRSRGNVSMEHNLGDARNRNSSFYISLLCFCLIADRFHLLGDGIAAALAPQYRVAAIVALMSGYMLLRHLTWILILIVQPPRNVDSETRAVMHNGYRNYFIVAVALMLVAVVLFRVFGAGQDASRLCLWLILSIMFLFMLLRIGKIFRASCSFLATISYLCTLEILPLGALTVAAMFMQDIIG